MHLQEVNRLCKKEADAYFRSALFLDSDQALELKEDDTFSQEVSYKNWFVMNLIWYVWSTGYRVNLIVHKVIVSLFYCLLFVYTKWHTVNDSTLNNIECNVLCPHRDWINQLITYKSPRNWKYKYCICKYLLILGLWSTENVQANSRPERNCNKEGLWGKYNIVLQYQLRYNIVYLRNDSYFGAVHADWTCTRELANP